MENPTDQEIVEVVVALTQAVLLVRSEQLTPARAQIWELRLKLHEMGKARLEATRGKS